MPRPLQTTAYRDFLGLFDGVPAEAQPGQAAEVANFYKDREALRRRKGFTALGSALSPAQSHDGLAWYKIDSTEFLIAAHNGSLVDWFHATPGTALTGSAGKLTAGTDANAAWIDGRMYWGDGIKQNVRHDGTDVQQVLPAAPATAPTVAAGSATGLTGAYAYFVTFVNGDGLHSAASPQSAVVSVTDQKIDLTDIPTAAAGQNVVARAIWRNKDAFAEFYLVTTIADNTTTTYTDSTLDDDLIEPLTDILGLNLQNERIPPCRFLIAHQNRLVGAFCTTAEGDQQTIYVSNFREPWYSPLVPDTNDPTQGGRFPLQGPAAGEITGLASHGSQIYAFTSDAAWVLTTSDQLLDWTLHRFANNGCVAHRTIASVKDLIIWAAPDGIYVTAEGKGVTRISDDVKRTYQSISAADLAKAHAFVWDDRYYFCWPSGTLVYDLKYNIWTRNTNWNWRCSTVSVFGGGQQERIYAAQNGVARVFQLENGTTDNGTAITATWASHDMDFGLPARDKRLHSINAHWKTATGTATVKLYRGTGTDAIQTATKNLAAVDDTGATVAVLQQRCNEKARSERFRIEVEYSGAAEDYQLLQTEILWNQIT